MESLTMHVQRCIPATLHLASRETDAQRCVIIYYLLFDLGSITSLQIMEWFFAMNLKCGKLFFEHDLIATNTVIL